uniref:Uncharacterized protein n=1 Tax=Human herpesvirus 1 TaxID=10298 RepID=A0A2Z4H0L0_HHV1|nr:hypothetical protein [Human alphaherpesvirus 1]
MVIRNSLMGGPGRPSRFRQFPRPLMGNPGIPRLPRRA